MVYTLPPTVAGCQGPLDLAREGTGGVGEAPRLPSKGTLSRGRRAELLQCLGALDVPA